MISQYYTGIIINPQKTMPFGFVKTALKYLFKRRGMHLIGLVLLAFSTIRIPYLHIKNNDLLSLWSISSKFDLDTEVTDSIVRISFGTDNVFINTRDLTYTGKTEGTLKSLKKDSNNIFISAEDIVYITGVLKGKYYYWDAEKHRIIESGYFPSIKKLKVNREQISIIHNIDLEPSSKRIGKNILINIPYGFYFGPPFLYFDNAEDPIKSIEITYTSKGTMFKVHLRRDVPLKILKSTGLFVLKLQESTNTPTGSTNNVIKQKQQNYHSKIDVIVIDPGHGGKDPGAISKRGTREKDITLSIAKKLAKKLRKKGFKVILTRDRDKFLTLGERARIANKSKCDLFISIHANYSKGQRAHGIETYFLSEARTKWERSVAAFENSVIKYEIKEETSGKNILKWILGDMAQNEFLRESQDLAAFVERSVTKKAGSLDRGVKQAGFYVLRGVYAPSILIETGFITNPKEEKLLKSNRYQNKIADGITEGILKYKRYYERKYGRF